MSNGWLQASPAPLSTEHDVALLDLDGVVYVGAQVVPGVPGIIAASAGRGMRFGYVTNNASRTPREVGDHLRELGIPATDDEIITSSQAAGRLLADRLPQGSPILIVGTAALAAEVERAGLRAVWSAAEAPAGIVQGYSPDLSWSMLAEACVAIRADALWVATNTDATLPSPRGAMPGNGSFVQVVASTTGATPVVAGKPEPAMHRECLLRTGAQRPLIVGDRLDTDIEGAIRVGVPSMLVLTGLADADDLLACDEHQRPTYLAADLGGILVAHPGVQRDETGTGCGSWRVIVRGGTLVLSRAGGTDAGTQMDQAPDSGDRVDALRALAVLAWETGITRTAAGDAPAGAALGRLGLPAGD